MGLIYYWNKLLKKLKGSAIRDSMIHRTSKIEAGSQVIRSKMDRYSFCGYDCKILNCKIGAFCSIADNVVIGGAQHPISWVSTSPVFYAGKDSVKMKFSEFERSKDPETIIGNDVWIGERALIKAGVTIGDGAVVGMGSIVTKSIGPYEIWAGNPARFIKNRFDEETISLLTNTKWWSLPDSEIKRLARNITQPRVFLEDKE